MTFIRTYECIDKIYNIAAAVILLYLHFRSINAAKTVGLYLVQYSCINILLLW